MINPKAIQLKKIINCLTFMFRLSLGCLFIYSGIPKIRQPYDFLHSVYNYEIVGPKLGLLVSMALPWMELLVGICLIGGVFVSGALLISIGMGAMFSYVIGSALYRELNISCGCFDAASTEQIGYATLIRACVILMLSLATYMITIINRSHDTIQKSNP